MTQVLIVIHITKLTGALHCDQGSYKYSKIQFQDFKQHYFFGFQGLQSEISPIKKYLYYL